LEDLSISEAGLQLIIARDLISLKTDKSLALLGNTIKNSLLAYKLSTLFQNKDLQMMAKAMKLVENPEIMRMNMRRNKLLVKS